MGHTVANGLHKTCGLHSQRDWQWQRIKPDTLIDVYEIQTASLVSDAYLSGSRFADFQRHEFQNLRPAEFFDYDRF